MQGWLGLLWALERAPDQLAAILERNIFDLLSSEETVGELLSNALWMKKVKLTGLNAIDTVAKFMQAITPLITFN